jgi:hypothetical protein
MTAKHNAHQTVAVVFHHIGPYHHARLNAAADKLSVTGIEWSAQGYDAWGTAATPVRYHQVSLFSEASPEGSILPLLYATQQ